MGIEDGIGEAAEQAKKVVTGDKEDKQNTQNKQQDDDDSRGSVIRNVTDGKGMDSDEFLGGQ